MVVLFELNKLESEDEKIKFCINDIGAVDSCRM